MTKHEIVAFASVSITTGANVAFWLRFCANMKSRFDSLDLKLDGLCMKLNCPTLGVCGFRRCAWSNPTLCHQRRNTPAAFLARF